MDTVRVPLHPERFGLGERKLIEVRLAGAKLGAEGSAMLRELAAQPASDNVVLVLAGKLDRDVEKSAWFRALDEAGATVRAWPLRRSELPGWIGQRLRAAGFRPSPDALALLAERVEGNLLAARQEIDKLALLAEPGPLDAATLATLVNARAEIAGAAHSLWARILWESGSPDADKLKNGISFIFIIAVHAADIRKGYQIFTLVLARIFIMIIFFRITAILRADIIGSIDNRFGEVVSCGG